MNERLSVKVIPSLELYNVKAMLETFLDVETRTDRRATIFWNRSMAETAMDDFNRLKNLIVSKRITLIITYADKGKIII